VAFIRETFGATHLATTHQFGGVAPPQVLASMGLFAGEVAPRFRS